MSERHGAITAVGPVGYDDVETPRGAYRHLLGGSAVFFALAAAAFAPTRIVAAVGDDLDAGDLASLAACGVDTTGIRRLRGRSHHWAARYSADLARAETLDNDLGVMAGWSPVLPSLGAGDVLFVGSLEPATQLALVASAPGDVFTLLDTQAHWIAHDRTTLLEAARGASLLCVNDDEAMRLAGATDPDAAAGALLAAGCAAVVVKAGTSGATLHHRGGRYVCPALPLAAIGDPTGAGDAFAGGLAGHLATAASRDTGAVAASLRYGVACATLRLELPPGERVRAWSRAEIRGRAAALAVVRT